MAALLIIFLKQRTKYFPEDITEEALEEVSKLLLKHILQLICNAHSIVIPVIDMDDNQVSRVAHTTVATAIYPSASIMNHSCSPNIVNSFIGNRLVVRSAEDVAVGDGIFNCYGPMACKMSAHKRQQTLMQQYGFQCRCSACLEPFDHVDLIEAFKCSCCSGPLVTPENACTLICQICYQPTRITNEMLQHRDKSQLLAKLNESPENTFSIGLNQVMEIWLNARKALYCWNIHLIGVTRFLAACLAQEGHLRLGVRLLSVASKPAKKCYAHSTQDTLNFFLSLSTMADQALQTDCTLTTESQREIADISQKTQEEIKYLKVLHYSFVESPSYILM